jgi:hypothetical protein
MTTLPRRGRQRKGLAKMRQTAGCRRQLCRVARKIGDRAREASRRVRRFACPEASRRTAVKRTQRPVSSCSSPRLRPKATQLVACPGSPRAAWRRRKGGHTPRESDLKEREMRRSADAVGSLGVGDGSEGASPVGRRPPVERQMARTPCQGGSADEKGGQASVSACEAVRPGAESHLPPSLSVGTPSELRQGRRGRGSVPLVSASRRS